jgi:class 3 adenylate cyclase
VDALRGLNCHTDGSEGGGVDDRPVTRYAESQDGGSIAYQIVGDGPIDLVVPPTVDIAIDFFWDEPSFVRVARRLGRFSRTVWYDGRGIGASGGNFADSLVDEIVDADLTAVLDAVGSERAALVGWNQGGATVIRHAAGHTERVSALVLIDTYAHYVQEADYPWGMPAELLDEYSASTSERWSTGAGLELFAPSKAQDPAFRDWWARGHRLGIGADQAAASMRAGARRDVRALLPAITVPTLVLHRAGDLYVRVEAGRYLAEHIPGAKYVELPGADHAYFLGDTDALLDEIEEFLTGGRQAPEGDVVTATIVFTDIVDSTAQSARMGHRKWSNVVADHDAMIRATLDRYRGREIKTIGDGFLATFDASTRAVRAAQEIVRDAAGLGIAVRAGVHTGEVEVRPGDVVGLPVSIAKRICDAAGPAEALVSQTVRDLAGGSDINFVNRGAHAFKGLPGRLGLWAVT